MEDTQTIYELLGAGDAAAVAIAAPGREPMTFGELRRQVVDTVRALNRLGLGRGDSVAIVLPNGPEMATAFVAVASGCTSAPLNPAYRAEEFEFYLTDLAAKALIVEAGSDSPAVQVARSLDVDVIRLVPDPTGPVGRFTLLGSD